MAEQNRIAILSPLLSKRGPIQGGIEAVIINLANALAARRARVTLLGYGSGHGDAWKRQLVDSVDTFDIGTHHKFAGSVAVARYLNRYRPTALLAAGHRCNVMAARARLRTSTSTRIVLSVHNTMSQRLRLASPLRRWQQRRQINNLFPKADAVIAVSQGVANDLVNLGYRGPSPQVIHNPVVSDVIKERLEAQAEHPWLNEGEPPLILAVGRLQPQKDYATLLRAFAHLRKERMCRLMIIGEGPERQHLEHLVHELEIVEDVALPGGMDNPLPYMRRAAAYAMSSRWEGLPTVLIEALAAGAPVVSTDCPSGPREILEEGKLGLLVPVADDSALATALAQTLHAPPDRSLLQASAARFSIDRATEAYLSVLTGSTQPTFDQDTGNT